MYELEFWIDDAKCIDLLTEYLLSKSFEVSTSYSDNTISIKVIEEDLKSTVSQCKEFLNKTKCDYDYQINEIECAFDYAYEIINPYREYGVHPSIFY